MQSSPDRIVSCVCAPSRVHRFDYGKMSLKRHKQIQTINSLSRKIHLLALINLYISHNEMLSTGFRFGLITKLGDVLKIFYANIRRFRFDSALLFLLICFFAILQNANVCRELTNHRVLAVALRWEWANYSRDFRSFATTEKKTDRSIDGRLYATKSKPKPMHRTIANYWWKPKWYGIFILFSSAHLLVASLFFGLTVWLWGDLMFGISASCALHSNKLVFIRCVLCVCEWLWITNIKSIIIIRLNSDCLKRCSHIWIVVNANSAQIFIICIICVWWLNQIALLKCKSMRYNPLNIMRLDRFQLTMVLFIARLDAESLSLRLESLLTHLMCRRDERGRMCLLPKFRYETIQNN